MKTKRFLKLSIFAVVCVMMLNCVCPAHAAVAFGDVFVHEMPVTGDYPNGLYVSMVTSSYDTSDRQPIGLRAEHKHGVNTTISVSAGVSATSTSSAEFGFEVTSSAGLELGLELLLQVNAALSSTVSVTAQVSESYTYTLAGSISYTLNDSVPEGIYSCYLVFPRKRVVCGVYTYDSDGNKRTIDTNIITYAPMTDDSYITWDVYEIGS